MSQVLLIGGGPEMKELCADAGLDVVGSVAEPGDPKILQAFPKLPLVLAWPEGIVRKKLVEHYQREGRTFVGAVHPEAKISPEAEIGMGAVIQYGCFVSAGCRVGAFSLLDVGSILMQDAVIENYCTLGPRALLLASSRLKALVSVGANATISGGLVLAEGTAVAPAALVT